MERGHGWWAGPARAWVRGENGAIYCPFASPCPPSFDFLFKVTSLRERALSLSLNSLNKSLIIQLCPIYFLCFSSFLSFAVSSSCFGLLLDAVGACYRVVVVVVVPLPHPPSPQSCWARLIFSRPFRLLLLYAIIKRRGEKFVVVCMFWRRRWRRVSVLKNFPRQIHPVSF